MSTDAGSGFATDWRSCPASSCCAARALAETERLQRQVERLRTDTSDEAIWNRVELARRKAAVQLDYVERMLETGSSCTATRAAWTTPRL